MSQISPPLRILLVGAVVFMAAWFAFLRPGGATDAAAPSAAAPATDTTVGNARSGPGRAVEAAQGAARAATARGRGDAPATSPRAGARQGAGADAAPAAARDADLDAADLPRPVTQALSRDKVLVVLFWNPNAADDRAVRAALRRVDRHRGDVVVHVANLAAISRYTPITRGVQVEQSPSTVVVDRSRQAALLTGYVDARTIDQAVSDALRSRAPRAPRAR